VARHLAQDGNDVTTVTIAGSFGSLGDRRYGLDPTSRDDYVSLLRDLRQRSQLPERILHLWNVSEPGDSNAQSGRYSLLYLAQALASEADGASPSITAVTSHAADVTGDEELNPAHAMAFGFAKTIQQELKYPCQVVDINLSNATDIRKSAQSIASELRMDGNESVVAYRGNYRWIQRFRPTPPRASHARPLRDGGAYMIVGGLGQVGLDLALYVAEQTRGTLVLVSRTALPAPELWQQILRGPQNAERHKIERIQELEKAGARVSIQCADASDARQMAEVVSKVDREFGRLDGVFHAAGSKVSNAIHAFSREEGDQQLRPKIEGLQVLEEVLHGRQLDFVVVVSSLASVLGAIGFPAYPAAHAYVDCFVQKHNRSHATRWTCINLDNWLGTNEAALPSLRDRFQLAMSFSEGCEVIGRVLSSSESSRWLISTADLDLRAETWLSPAEPEKTQPPSSSAHPRPSLSTEYVAPRNAVERKLADIWQQLLGIEHVGIHDNFFELGGDSVVSIQIIARARQAELVLTPKQMFEHQTIAELASLAGNGARRADRGAVTGSVPLTPIQRWFFDRDYPDPHYFNMAVLLELEGVWPAETVSRALQSLLAHHDALRLRFHRTENGWESKVIPAETLSFRCENTSQISENDRSRHIESIANETHASLHLSDGPLFRAVLFDPGQGAASRLLLVAHHLLMDLISWQILIEDFQTACEQLSRGQEIRLPARTDSVKRWAEQLIAEATGNSRAGELSYWADDARKDVQTLPVDHASGRQESTAATVQMVSAELDSDETKTLLHEIPAHYGVQAHEALLAAMARTLARWSGSSKLLVDVEGIGRDSVEGDLDVSRTVGWFTNVYPVLLHVSNADDAEETLREVGSQLKLVPNRGSGYGILRYLSDETIAQRLRDLPEPEVCFLYQGHVNQGSTGAAPVRQVHESTGLDHSPRTPLRYLFALNAWVAADRLHVNWIYSDRLYDRDTVERISAEFREALRRLAAACKSSPLRDQQKEISEFNWDQSDVLDIAAAIGKALNKS